MCGRACFGKNKWKLLLLLLFVGYVDDGMIIMNLKKNDEKLTLYIDHEYYMNYLILLSRKLCSACIIYNPDILLPGASSITIPLEIIMANGEVAPSGQTSSKEICCGLDKAACIIILIFIIFILFVCFSLYMSFLPEKFF